MKRSGKDSTPFGAKSGGGFDGFSTSSTTLSYITIPPDLSDIPQDVVVPFKNLLKKDGITKAKALEEIVSYVQAQSLQDGGIQESILEAWTELYARVSIDNARRVRELSHALMFELLKSAGKRMQRRIPSIVGPWLAGTFDKDRAISRAAIDGLDSFLTTDDKKTQFWTKCASQILEFATEAIKETPDTLSDARSSTKEDSLAKYYRVVGSSLSLVLNVMEKVGVHKLENGLDVYFEVEAVWSMATCEESFVRKALYGLLRRCLEMRPESLKPRLPQIGRILVADSLKSNQSGSSAELVAVLTNLTEKFPEVWGTKRHPALRLQPFVEKGSQGGSPAFWEQLGLLIVTLPEEIKTTEEVATSFLKSLRVGINNRQEPRTNAPAAWQVYIDAVQKFFLNFTPSTDFLQRNIYPLTRQYLHPATEHILWTAPAQPSIFLGAWEIVAYHPSADLSKSAQDEWQSLGEAFLSRMSNSLPEVAKDHQQSQHGLVAEGERWFALVATLLGGLREGDDKNNKTKPIRDMITTSTENILEGALDLLSRRNYKPFGAASVLETGFKKCPLLCVNNDDLVSSLFPLGNADAMKSLVLSPSLPYLLLCLDKASSTEAARFEQVFTALIDCALDLEPAASLSAISSLISIPCGTALSLRHERLQEFLVSNWLKCTEGSTATSSTWALSEATLSFSVVSADSLRGIVAKLLQHLDTPSTSGGALRALELIVKNNAFLILQDKRLHMDLITKLLALTEISADGVSGKARALQALLGQQPTEHHPLIGILERNLEDAGPLSLGVDILTQQAADAVTLGGLPAEDLFPNSNVWMTEIRQFLLEVPNPSLSLTSSMGGAYFLVKAPESSEDVPEPKRDRQGRSIPARMAVFTSKLLSSGVKLSSLHPDFQVELVYLLSLTAALAADQLTLMQANELWASIADEGISDEIEDFVTSAKRIINDIVIDAKGWRESDLRGDSLVERLITIIMLPQIQDFSPMAFYTAKVLSDLFQALTETYGPLVKAEELFSKLGVMKATPKTIFVATAFVTGFGQTLASSKVVTALTMRLVSEMFGASPGFERTFYSVVLLSACMSVYEAGEVPVENRKQVVALKQMTQWTDTPGQMSNELAAETCKVIHRLFPNVKDIYGPYWEQTVDYCLYLWKKATKDPVDVRLPYIHSSLKLMSTLEASTDANEDLVEILVERSKAKSDALLGLLKIPREKDTQPCQIVDEVLCRAVDKIPLEHLDDLSDLYGLVASDSRAIQGAAFGLLHRALPVVQEKLSVDVLLEKKVARLPNELLSLLLDPPTLEAYPDDLLAQFPTPVRSYLLSWSLIFDAYSKASFKVRGDYTDALKEEGHFDPLMNFMFDVLGHSAASPLHLDKEGFTADHIRSYDIKLADAEPEERNMNWLLIHLFYLSLKYMPGMFKTWYINCGSKQTKVAVESWLLKYFSPLAVADALSEVSQWADNQDTSDDDEKELLVKVSNAAREITAGYEVDDEVASMIIRIPSAYPLGTVDVLSVNRVAVDEKSWQSWLKTTQGVIMFAHGSLADGLTVFKNNVMRAMKGQTECAICYSIVSSDKKLPDKRCDTCKHLYHRVCLYKWFTSSGGNTCPLCRNPIDYLGADTRAKRK
ncbi:hypothetical protein B0H63DRAFT_467712 [Podospora didyma]|uniref:E3 ubiquitin-protein ligase listerin n=1 Tax=Podospora didyma TaxID=330526 RepID=A0AAE0P0T2_9PEZI|nr:hypothetical protein B0H63DRAFT_467712 [Podospora didyma]